MFGCAFIVVYFVLLCFAVLLLKKASRAEKQITIPEQTIVREDRRETYCTLTVDGFPEVTTFEFPWSIMSGSTYSHGAPFSMNLRARAGVMSSSLHPGSHKRRANSPPRQPKWWAILLQSLGCYCGGCRHCGPAAASPSGCWLAAFAKLVRTTGV